MDSFFLLKPGILSKRVLFSFRKKHDMNIYPKSLGKMIVNIVEPTHYEYKGIDSIICETSILQNNYLKGNYFY